MTARRSHNPQIGQVQILLPQPISTILPNSNEATVFPDKRMLKTNLLSATDTFVFYR
jgi:hypothetical protein